MRTLGALCRLAAAIGLIFTAPGAQAAVNRLDRLVDARSFGGGMGVNIHLENYHRGDIAAIARVGFRLVRSDLLWARVETVRGQYDWRPYDALIADLRVHHLVPLMILAYSNPLYARRLPGRGSSDSLAYAAPVGGAARTAYMAFVKAAARRYGASVIWEIWNEPDQNFGDPVDLRGFVGFALEACAAIRAAAPDAPVIGPAASGFVWWFLRALRAADTGGCLDAISVHPYRDEAPESVLRDWTRARNELVSDCTTGRRCPSLVDSEWGYSATGRPWTEQRQADFDTRLRLLDMMAGVKLTIIYDWRDDGPNPTDKEANFGLLDFHGAPKPAFRAMADAVRSLAGLSYIGALKTNRRGDQVLAFGKGDSADELVAWSSIPGSGAISLADVACRQPLTDAVAAAAGASCGSLGDANRQIRLSETPAFIDLDRLLKAGGKHN